MGKIADIVSSPEFAAKTPLEKAQARRDLFALALEEFPQIKAAFDTADEAGRQKIVDDFKRKVDAEFPDAFSTKGFGFEAKSGGNVLVYRDVRTPVYDVATEQLLARAAPASSYEGFTTDERYKENERLFQQLAPEQRRALTPFVFERYGDSTLYEPAVAGETSKPLFGRVSDLKEFITHDESTGKKVAKFAIPAFFRIAPPAVASLTKNPRAVAIAAGAGDAVAQHIEIAMGARTKFSPAEMGLNSVLSLIPAATIGKLSNPTLNMAARVGIRGVEGAGQGALFEAGRQVLEGEKPDGGKVGTSAAFGAGLGALIGGFEAKIAAMISGKTAKEAAETLRDAAARAKPEEQAALTAAQKRIEEFLQVNEAPATSRAAVDANLGVDQPNPELTALNKELGEQQAAGVAANATRAADFERARIEEIQASRAADIEAATSRSEELQTALRERQLGAGENVVLGDNPTQNQLTALDTRPGDAARERARLEAEVAASKPQVDDGSLPPGIRLSRQAQSIHDNYGFVSPRLMMSLAGSGGGFVYGASGEVEGATQAEQLENRIKRGLVFGVMGLGGGYMLGRRFSQPGGVRPAANGVLADVDRVLTKPQGPTVGERLAGIPDAIRTALITRFAPLDTLQRQVMNAAGRPMPAVPLARKFEQVAGAGGKAMVDVDDFERAIVPVVKGNERDFDRLLFLKRTGQRLQQDVNDAVEAARVRAIPETSRTADEAAFLASYTPDRRRVAGWDIAKVDQGLAELETLLGQRRFDELDQVAAGAFQQELDRNLRLQVTSGRMTPAAYAAVKASNDFYAPFRVLRTLEDIDAGRMPAGIDTREQIVRAISGIDDGEFHLDSPTKAAAENIYHGRVLAERNEKMLELAKLTADDPSGIFIRKLKPWESPRRGFETVNYFEGGAPMKLEVSPEVAEAVKGLNPAETGIIVEAFKRTGALARFGTTSANLAFQVRNFAFADQPRLMLMSKYGFNAGDILNPLRIPTDFASALLSSIKSNVAGMDDDLARAFYESGAAGSTLQDSISRLGGRFDAPPTAARQVIDTFEDFTRVLEETTKMMGFKRAVRIEGLDAMGPAQRAAKLEEVAAEIRNYGGSPDFARGGKVAKDLSMLTLFFNARVQGAVSDLSRLGGADGAKTALAAWARIGTAVGIPAAYFWLRNHEQENAEDFKRVPQWERENYLLVPRYDEKGAPLYFTNAQGEKVREYWRIPKRETAQHVANLTDAAMDFANSKDPKAVGAFARKFLDGVSPVNVSGETGTERLESVASGLNPLVKVPAEVTTNRNFFRHQPIVPESRQGASPENQYFAGSTPQGYVDAAHAMPQFVWDPLRSPLMLRHIVGGYTGGLVNQFAEDRTRTGERDETTAALAKNPVGRVFVRSQTNDMAEETEAAKAALRGAADRTVEMDNAAASELDSLAKLAPAAKEARVRELERSNPRLVDAIADEAEARAKNLTQPDRLARRMPVRDGTRARYVVERFKRLPIERREQFLRDQVAKGIITDEVLDQVVELLGTGKN